MEKLRLRRSARKDSERIEELVYEDYYKRVPMLEGFSEEEETICKKVVDKDGKIIGGCTGYVYPWGCIYIDDMWVDENYRRQGIGSQALQAVEKAAEAKGCHLIWLGTWDFQARPYYIKHGYEVFSTMYNCPDDHVDYNLFKRLDIEHTYRVCKPIEYQILDGSEEDAKYICDQLDYGFNAKYVKEKHDYIKINRKLVNKEGKVVAAIMAGVNGFDLGWIWKIWVDEEYRNNGLASLLIRHYEKKAKEKGATKIISEEIYDWNVDFFLKNGYKVAGELKELPKGHSHFLVEKDL